MSARCGASTGERDHEAPYFFGGVTMRTCGAPSAWTVEAGGVTWPACERCAADALRYEQAAVSDMAGNEVAMDDQGELVPT